MKKIFGVLLVLTLLLGGLFVSTGFDSADPGGGGIGGRGIDSVVNEG